MNKLLKIDVPFAQIANELLNDKNISAKAKGIYAFMYSKPNGWTFTIRSMSKQLKEGKESIRTAITELKHYGWIGYKKHTDGTGNYKLHVKPLHINQVPETPTWENPNVGKSERISNKESVNKKEKETNKDAVVISLRKLGIKNTKKITDNYSESYINDRIDIANEKSSSNPAGYFIEILDKEVTQELVEPM